MRYFILHLFQVGNAFKWLFRAYVKATLTVKGGEKRENHFLNSILKHAKPRGGAKVTKDEFSQNPSYRMCRMWPDEI